MHVGGCRKSAVCNKADGESDLISGLELEESGGRFSSESEVELDGQERLGPISGSHRIPSALHELEDET